MALNASLLLHCRDEAERCGGGAAGGAESLKSSSDRQTSIKTLLFLFLHTLASFVVSKVHTGK